MMGQHIKPELPDSIKDELKNLTYEVDGIGMSGSGIFLFQTKY